MENKKIRFKDLSGWVKVAICTAWFTFGVYVFYFVLGALSVFLEEAALYI